MDTLLTVVTALSLAMAISMGVLVLKLLRDERRRSDARVATLLEMAGEQPAVPERPGTPAELGLPVPLLPPEGGSYDIPRTEPSAAHQSRGFRLQVEDSYSRVLAGPAARRVVATERTVSRAAGPAAREIELELRPESPGATAGVGSLFSEPAATSSWLARIGVAAALAMVIAGAGYVWLSSSSPSAVPVPLEATTAAPVSAPLELLSLRHAQENGGLAVSGLVQNPHSGATLTRVIATAIAFDADGTFLASGRAPLDFTTLAPGNESPFVVHVPVTGAVARYRIGFRAEDGDTIAHIDKRGTPEAIARK